MFSTTVTKYRERNSRYCSRLVSECTVGYAVSPLMGLSRRRSVLEDVAVKHSSRRALFQVITWQGEPQSTVGVPVTGVDVAEPDSPVKCGCVNRRAKVERIFYFTTFQASACNCRSLKIRATALSSLVAYRAPSPRFLLFPPSAPFDLQHMASPCGVSSVLQLTTSSFFFFFGHDP